MGRQICFQVRKNIMHKSLVCSLLKYMCVLVCNDYSPLPLVPNIHCSHPWEKMAEAAFRKYPNPHSGNVHTLDTIERRVTATGKLFSHRIFGTLWNIPTIALNVCFEFLQKLHHFTSVCIFNRL